MLELVIGGICKPEFQGVYNEFARNFEARGEVGASVCIIQNDEVLVDLWGGIADQISGRPWEENTKCVVWSTTKGMTAMCALVLVDRGLLDINALVTDYWPEYGQNGKENTKVSHLLNHQAGLCVVTEQIPHRGIFDWNMMTGIIERQKPQFEPGTRVGYSALMYGWLVGELARRVSGKSFGTFFRDEIAEPLRADCWLGLPKELEHETARVIVPDQPLFPDGSIPGYEIAEILFKNSGGYLDFTKKYDGLPLFDTSEAHAAEIGGGGGIANARGLARLYAPWANGGKFGDIQLIMRETAERAGMTVSAISIDSVLRYPTWFSLGFQKTWDNRHISGASHIFGVSAFGHSGFGGSIAFAEPEEGMSFGYVMNRMGNGGGINERGQSLIDAAYRSLGFTSDKSGGWRR